MIDVADSKCVDEIRPSANFEPRRLGVRPDILLLHYTGMTSAARAIDWLCRPESRVSSHYVIDEQGRVTQLVAEGARAWHAGVASWRGETDINSLSIGIEIHNPGHDDGYPDFPEAQMARLEALCRDIVQRWQIVPERVLAHSDVAPRRKIDPGEKFDWERLHAAGVGYWVAPAPLYSRGDGFDLNAGAPEVLEAQQRLAQFGYGVPLTGALDEETVVVLTAFQRHFRPARCDGRLDGSTLDTLRRLTKSVPPTT